MRWVEQDAAYDAVEETLFIMSPVHSTYIPCVVFIQLVASGSGLRTCVTIQSCIHTDSHKIQTCFKTCICLLQWTWTLCLSVEFNLILHWLHDRLHFENTSKPGTMEELWAKCVRMYVQWLCKTSLLIQTKRNNPSIFALGAHALRYDITVGVRIILIYV